MKLLSSEAFFIQLISESTEREPPKSQIWTNGKAINAYIPGEVCEACIHCGEYYVVFTTNNAPYEESLNICILDRNFIQLDHAVLAWSYNTGSFTFIKLIKPNLIVFKFFEGATWQLEIYAKKKFIFPYVSEPAGVWRKFKLRHYFKISKTLSS